MTTHTHRLTLNQSDLAWPVDPTAAAKVAKWVKRKPDVFAADLAGMADYFPHWYLAASQNGQPQRCPACFAPIIPTAGDLRCPQCHQAQPADGLIWLGHIPVLARPEPEFQRHLPALEAAGFPSTAIEGATYLLVPLLVSYPATWPNTQPEVRYPPRWLKALGLPLSNGNYHLIGQGKACIFLYNDWHAMPIHAVLQQRVINHILSLLKVAAGQNPTQAFIGMGHHTTPPQTPDSP